MKTYTTIYNQSVNINEDDICYKIPLDSETDRLFMSNKQFIDVLSVKPLPEGFERLKYIQTSGTGVSYGQYLDTTFESGEDMIFKIQMELTDGATGTSISGTAKTMFTTKGYGGGAGVKKPGTIYVMYIEGDRTKEGSFSNPFAIDDPTGQYNMHTYIIDYKNHQLGCDDLRWDMKSEVTKFATEYPFAIGGWYEAGTIFYRASGKFKTFEVEGKNKTTGIYGQLIYLEAAITTRDICENGVLKYPTNTPGMYDFTKKKFIVNSGEGKLGYEKKDGTYVAPVL